MIVQKRECDIMNFRGEICNFDFFYKGIYIELRQ
jgi:hypothetical protein